MFTNLTICKAKGFQSCFLFMSAKSKLSRPYLSFCCSTLYTSKGPHRGFTGISWEFRWTAQPWGTPLQPKRSPKFV